MGDNALSLCSSSTNGFWLLKSISKGLFVCFFQLCGFRRPTTFLRVPYTDSTTHRRGIATIGPTSVTGGVGGESSCIQFLLGSSLRILPQRGYLSLLLNQIPSVGPVWPCNGCEMQHQVKLQSLWLEVCPRPYSLAFLFPPPIWLLLGKEPQDWTWGGDTAYLITWGSEKLSYILPLLEPSQRIGPKGGEMLPKELYINQLLSCSCLMMRGDGG